MSIPVEFASGKPLIGMVHLLPLPGSPRWSGRMDQVIERALRDADALIGAGFDGLLLENLGDTPFWPAQVEPETVAAMSVVADRLRNHSELPLGINVLRNDARAAIAIAKATDAVFIRVNVHTGAAATDREEQRRIWRDFTLALQESQPVTFMFWVEELAASRTEVGGVEMDPRGEFMSITEWSPGGR